MSGPFVHFTNSTFQGLRVWMEMFVQFVRKLRSKKWEDWNYSWAYDLNISKCAVFFSLFKRAGQVQFLISTWTIYTGKRETYNFFLLACLTFPNCDVIDCCSAKLLVRFIFTQKSFDCAISLAFKFFVRLTLSAAVCKYW